MLEGLLPLPWWGYIVVAFVVTHITIVAVTIFLHRCQSHRALELHPIVSHFFRFWLWLTTAMVTKEWVAIHRKHHARVETESDPHSPQVLGLSRVVWSGAELYRAEYLNNPQTLEEFGQGTPDDWLENCFYGRGKLTYLGIFIDMGLCILAFGPVGLSIWAVQMAWIPFFGAGIVNGVGHYWGYRNFLCPDASTNIVPWGFLIGGEELHNNHHAFIGSAKFSIKPWEFDLGWLYIRVFCALGLARVKRVAPTPTKQPAKHDIDQDTVKAVFTHRMYVLAEYAKSVMVPVHREQADQAGRQQQRILRPVKQLLMRPRKLMDKQQREILEHCLLHSRALGIVYEFKQRLQSIWAEYHINHEAAHRALDEWCRSAENSGILALQDFSRNLRTYSMASV